MGLENLITEMKEKARFAPSLGAKVKFDLGADGIILFDGTASPPVISETDSEADTVFTLSQDNLKALMNGQLDPTMAYMMGKVKIAGKMGIAMKMAGFLGD